jgi:hypothetical protein
MEKDKVTKNELTLDTTIYCIQAGMMAFVIGMCLALPIALLPQYYCIEQGSLPKSAKNNGPCGRVNFVRDG